MKKSIIAGVAWILFQTSIGCSKSTDSQVDPAIIQNPARRFSYNNGTYTATGEYGNLPSHLIVTIGVRTDTIRTVTVEPQATDPTSLALQRSFAAAVPAVVIGKHIDEVNVGHLAGSSGTPVGFNDAVAKIKRQAIKTQ